MPKFRYQCLCGLQFDVFAPAGPDKKPVPCPACKETARRMLPSTVAGVFVASVTGPTPQNTGIASLDADPDRVIGQAARQGWMAIEKRVNEKIRVLNSNPGVSGKDLSRNLDGSYRILSSEERGVHDRALAISQAADSRNR